MKKIVVFTGAGMSAESGIQTFRDTDGLWENHNIMDVATLEGWEKNPEFVLDFYNDRRKQIIESDPNQGHISLANLEDKFDVTVITQNIDDLHERAGSSNVIHLHGEIRKARSTVNANLIYDLDDWKIKIGDKCELGSQLRPHVVWFGEAVPMITTAISKIAQADIFLVIGTSLDVSPASELVDCAADHAKKYIIDIKDILIKNSNDFIMIKEKASKGVSLLSNELLNNWSFFEK